MILCLGIGDIGLFSMTEGKFEIGVLVGFRDHTTFNCVIKFPASEGDTEDYFSERSVEYAIIKYKNVSG